MELVRYGSREDGKIKGTLPRTNESVKNDYRVKRLLGLAQAVNKAVKTKSTYQTNLAKLELSQCLSGLDTMARDRVIGDAARICMSKNLYVTLNTIINTFPDCEIERSVKPTVKLIMAVMRGNLFDAHHRVMDVYNTVGSRPQFLDSEIMEKMMRRSVLFWIKEGNTFPFVTRADHLKTAVHCTISVLGKEKARAVLEDNDIVEAFKDKLKSLYLSGSVNNEIMTTVFELRDAFASIGSVKYAEIFKLDFMFKDIFEWATRQVMSTKSKTQLYRPDLMLRFIDTYGEKALNALFSSDFIEANWKPFIKRTLDEVGFLPKWCNRLKQYKKFENLIYSDEIVGHYAKVIEKVFVNGITNEIFSLAHSLADDKVMLRKLALYQNVRRAVLKYEETHSSRSRARKQILSFFKGVANE